MVVVIVGVLLLLILAFAIYKINKRNTWEDELEDIDNFGEKTQLLDRELELLNRTGNLADKLKTIKETKKNVESKFED